MPIPTFTDNQYTILNARKTRVDTFFSDLESTFSTIGAPTTYHLDIGWNGSKVIRISDGAQIQTLSLADRLKYYNQGLGLMKLAMNNQLYPV